MHVHFTRRDRNGSTIRSALALLLALVLAVLSGCSSSTADQSSQQQQTGPVTVGQTSVLQAVDPITSPWNLTAAGVSESVFLQDDEGELYSRFVDKVTQDGPLDWTLTLKDGTKFSDGSPVDAESFAWAMNQIQQQNELANASAGVMTFTPDGTMIKVHTERETKVMTSVLAEWTNIVYKKADDGSFVFTGPYVVKSLQSGSQLDLSPNPEYPDADQRSDVSIRAFPDADAMRLAIESGSIDMAFTITPEVAQQLEGKSGIHLKTIDAGYQYFAPLNLSSPTLQDKAVREALDLGLDRTAYTKALLGGQTANGLFAHYYSFAGDITLKHDQAQAERLLDDAGWVKGADGIRMKDGQRLTLSLVTYPSRPDLAIIMQIMVSQLKELGIDTKTSVADDIQSRLKEPGWDLAVYAQHTAPTGEPSYYLNQFYRTGAASNSMGYSASTTDAMLDHLGTLAPGTERDDEARKIQQQIHADLPVLFLVDPKWHIAVTDRLQNYQPYCGDYYVINPQLGLG